MNLKMVQFMWANGKMEKDMVVVNNTGVIIVYMRAIGKITWPMARVD